MLTQLRMRGILKLCVILSENIQKFFVKIQSVFKLVSLVLIKFFPRLMTSIKMLI